MGLLVTIIDKYKYKIDKKIRRIDSQLSPLSPLSPHNISPYAHATPYYPYPYTPLLFSLCMSPSRVTMVTMVTIKISLCLERVCKKYPLVTIV